MKLSKKKLAAAVAAGAVTVAGAGVAYAYWTGTGSGIGAATAASEASNTLTLGASATDLVPGGGTAGVYSIPVYATNAGPTSIAVDQLDMDTFTAGAACDAVSGASAVAVDPVSQVVVPAATSLVQVGSVDLTFPDLGAVDQGDCMGATWTFNLDASHS
jgi:hypothetical protein